MTTIQEHFERGFFEVLAMIKERVSEYQKDINYNNDFGFPTEVLRSRKEEAEEILDKVHDYFFSKILAG